MSLRRSSRLKSALTSPKSDQNDAQPHLRSQRGRSRLKGTDVDESEDCDIIDLIINENQDTDHAAKLGAAREAVGILSFGLDGSNDESGSESSSSSIVSGPSTLCYDKRDYDLCSACQKLYEKAKRLKTPMKSKLLDNDPESLTCDQWVLRKKWKPRRLPDVRRKLLSQVRLDDGVTTWQREQSSPCSRPHTFLQRNLRRASSSAEVKKTRRRRRKRRGNSQGSRVAKQQRLHNDQHTNIKGLVREPNGHFSSDARNRTSPGTESRCESDETVQRVPSSAARKAMTPAKARAQKRAPKKTCQFRDLLAQLRGNSSMIIRETC